MIDQFPYKFNVDSLEYEAVAEYLEQLASEKYRIASHEIVAGMSIAEWRAVRCEAARLDAEASGDDHQVQDADERAALLATDSNEKVEVFVLGTPATVSRRLLNRIAIQGGVNNAGITREAWSAALRRGIKSYLIQFADKQDAILFKLAMWKRPHEDSSL